MKKHVKALALSLCLVMGFAVVGCSTPAPQGIDETRLSKYTRDSYIMSVDGVELITGDNPYAVSDSGATFRYDSRNHTKFMNDDVGGTDLGIPFYNSKNNTMYILYGDTYGTGRAQTPDGQDRGSNWRSSVMAISKDYNLADGLTYDDWWRGGSDQAEAVIEGKHWDRSICVATGVEGTKIPQGAIELNGNVYIYYESIRYFGAGGTWKVNYQGVIKSTDNCQTFERVHDLTWFPTASKTDYFNYALYSAAEDWDEATYMGIETEADITPQILAEAKAKIPNAEERVAPYFSQCYPIDGKDGYVYVFGRRSGRQNGIKVARVAYENIEKFDEYEYFCGNRGNNPNQPIWKKGTEGLKAINNDEVGFVLASGKNEPASNMSVMWNEYLGKWMLFYFRPTKLAATGGEYYPISIGFRLSDTVWGNYGEFHKVLEQDFFLPDGPDGDFVFRGYDYLEKGYAQFNGDDAASFNMGKKKVKFYAGFAHEKYQELGGRVFYFILTLEGVYNSCLMKVTLN